MIQAVANCLNISIHIAEIKSNVEPVNVTNALNIYIGHVAEFHYVSTEENITMQLGDNSKQKKNSR